MKKKLIPSLLFLAGLLFFTYPYIAHYINDYTMQQQIEELETVSAQPDSEEDSEALWEEMRAYNEQLQKDPEQMIEDAFTDEVMASNEFYSSNQDGPENDSSLLNNPEGLVDNSHVEMEDVSASSGSSSSSLASRSFYSIIRIPKINIELPIYLGASDANLMKGAAHITGTSLPVGGKGTHAVIAGHRGTLRHNMFLHVNDLSAGDTFEVQTLDRTMTYRVTGSKVVLPNEVDSLSIQKDKDLVTLVTCLKYPMNDKRLLVYGERVN
ncbi:LPXTG-site transpeptidase (sortase) family protein [Alkalibacterium subtropicum]|uniref:LPXTG-site transpeptidase (Sortase) family protein n=1 Tax=Alkalibacterium subtropicum TaxID=753702 RepID=A0A1I1JJ48_9LACT|nr:class C sortase [Alkalibacterium subtropicum]SFC47992.1 LPXTG-site transpeptidase (sortase) family protein [Alkalibacterium subtropicum]